MTLSIVLAALSAGKVALLVAAMFLLVLVNNMNETPMCGDCGKMFTHADDCWRKKD